MGAMMAPADAVWFLGESAENPMTISAILWFDRSPDPAGLRAAIEERILERHPVFLQRAVPPRIPGTLPRWEDAPDFDLDAHVRTFSLPDPGDQATLQTVCSEERSTPLDRQRPLWAVSVHEGYRGDGCAIHARIHHSIGDGLALMQLLLTLADEYDETAVPVADPAPFGREALRLGGQAASMAARFVRHPTQAVHAVRTTAQATAWGVRLLTPTYAERTGLLGRPKGTKVMAWDPDGLPLAALRETAHRRGVTINDLVLTAMSGGFHRYLAERDELVDDVLVMVPINLRRPGEALPRHLGNRIGLLPILLPVRSGDPDERLRILRARVEELKGSPAPAISRTLLLATSLLTPPLERGIHRFNQLWSTGVVTNVPGPRETLHVAGARLLGTIGWGGMTGHLNLGAGFVSLDGRVFSGFVTDEAITSDPGRLLEHVQQEWLAIVAT